MPQLDEPAAARGESDAGDAGDEVGHTEVDLRMPLLGAVAWGAGLVAALVPELAPVVLVALLGLAVVVGRLRRWPRSRWLTVAGVTLVGLAVLGSTLLRHEAVARSPVAALAADRAVVDVTGVVVSDPRRVTGMFEDLVVVRLEVREVVGRGLRHELATRVLVIADTTWSDVALGALVSTTGRLSESDDDDLAGVLTGARAPELRAPPDRWWRGAAAVRSSIREAVSHRPPDQRALVPALVDGDDAGLDPGLVEDFRTTGLTHLTAVSGTNLTLVLGFLLVLARWCRVRGRWLLLVGALGIVGFVLLARTEPSVLRAAAMGTVGLLAMGTHGRQRAFRALGVTVVVLLLVQPALAVTVGFALSVLATAGIVVLAPGWRDALAGWLPRWLAEAVAVPAAAQLACTPVVAAISGQVSLVAVAANLLVAPAVGPATVLGLLGGLVGLVADPLGAFIGTGAGGCVAWIVLVARLGADLPAAAVDWSTGVLSLSVLVVLTVAVALLGPRLLRRPAPAIGVTLLLLAAMTVRLPTPGWPGSQWVVAMCDVGQGDALVLRAGPGAGVVVDAGPDPGAVDACLSRLGVEEVPLVVLTHFHADHVDGLTGVLDGRHVGEIWTTTLLDPPAAVADVRGLAGEEGIAAGLSAAGITRRYGDVTVQTIWPRPGPADPGPGDGSTANDASVVLLAEVRGVRILLTGDLEPPGQAALARALPGLEVDVLKVPHHGSRYQEVDWLESLDADLALVSVGADNDYGHPADSVLEALTAAGTDVSRTDQDGDVLVTPEGTRLAVRSRG